MSEVYKCADCGKLSESKDDCPYCVNHELSYQRGQRSALVAQLQNTLYALGGWDGEQPPEVEIARLTKYIEQIRETLRMWCESHGDNDWPDDLHLVDVIDKHLMRHIPEPEN